MVVTSSVVGSSVVVESSVVGSSVVVGSSSGPDGAVVGASVVVVSSTDAAVVEVVGAVSESSSSPKSGSGALSIWAGKGGSVSPPTTATSDPSVQLAATTENIAAIATINKGADRRALAIGLPLRPTS